MKRWSFEWGMVVVTMLLSIVNAVEDQYDVAIWYLGLSIWVLAADTNRRTK